MGALLGICFLMLGANTLYGTGIPLEASAGKFSTQIVDIFTTKDALLGLTSIGKRVEYSGE